MGSSVFIFIVTRPDPRFIVYYIEEKRCSFFVRRQQRSSLRPLGKEFRYHVMSIDLFTVPDNEVLRQKRCQRGPVETIFITLYLNKFILHHG